MGLAGSFGAAKLLANSLYGMEGTDLITFGGASVMLAGVALLASYIPARRATQIDPSQALREQ